MFLLVNLFFLCGIFLCGVLLINTISISLLCVSQEAINLIRWKLKALQMYRSDKLSISAS